MLLDNKRLAKLRAILLAQGIQVEDHELESVGINIARYVSMKEFLRYAPEQEIDYELRKPINR